jgi:hypothetical protein
MCPGGPAPSLHRPAQQVAHGALVCGGGVGDAVSSLGATEGVWCGYAPPRGLAQASVAWHHQIICVPSPMAGAAAPCLLVSAPDRFTSCGGVLVRHQHCCRCPEANPMYACAVDMSGYGAAAPPQVWAAGNAVAACGSTGVCGAFNQLAHHGAAARHQVM